MEKEKHYKDDYDEFWKEIVEKDGKLDKDAVMRELSDYHFMLKEIPKVYMAVSGGKISKPNTYAYEVIGEFEEQYWDKDTIQDDVKDILETELSAEEKLKEIKNYLEITNGN